MSGEVKGEGSDEAVAAISLQQTRERFVQTRCGFGLAEKWLAPGRFSAMVRGVKETRPPTISVRTANEQHGGDNPLFIRNMVGFFSRNRDWMAYEDYFNSERHRLHGSDQPVSPASSAAYREAFAAIPEILP